MCDIIRAGLLPQFVKDEKDEICSQSHFSNDIKGWVFEGASGHQATVWECDEDGQSQPHTHEFDEWLIVIAGEYMICSDSKRVPLTAGQQCYIPKGIKHWGAYKKHTQTINFFGGKRVEIKTSVLTNTNVDKIRDFIKKHNDFEIVAMNIEYIDHVGAIITDAIFQAGLDYDKVVLPRVRNIFSNYPKYDTVSLFLELIKSKSPEYIFQNKNKSKSKTAIELLELFKLNNLETTDQIKTWIKKDENIQSLKAIKGIGLKTIDYLMLLLHAKQTVAIDRHLIHFLELVGIEVNGYDDAKRIIIDAAKCLNINESDFDYSIWRYMSRRKKPFAIC